VIRVHRLLPEPVVGWKLLVFCHEQNSNKTLLHSESGIATYSDHVIFFTAQIIIPCSRDCKSRVLSFLQLLPSCQNSKLWRGVYTPLVLTVPHCLHQAHPHHPQLPVLPSGQARCPSVLTGPVGPEGPTQIARASFELLWNPRTVGQSRALPLAGHIPYPKCSHSHQISPLSVALSFAH
jgi:hypothetical protein